jgi:hypothetical protein
VVWLAWSHDPESYPGGSDATFMGSRAGPVEGDGPAKQGYSVPPGSGLGVRLTISPCKTYVCQEATKIGNWMEITKMTQNEQGLTSENVECAVSE